MRINNNIFKTYLAVLIMISTGVNALSSKELNLIPIPQKYKIGSR